VTVLSESVEQPFEEWVAAFADRWRAAWNSHDAEQVLALMHEDIVYEDDAWPAPMHGHADVREYLAHVWGGMPDMAFRNVGVPYVVPGERSAALRWTADATHTGEVGGFAATGKRAEWDGVDFHEYLDGKVHRLRTIFDGMTIARQLGVLG
jgi:steroid delta-isomerase-like uncharacterized protein